LSKINLTFDEVERVIKNSSLLLENAKTPKLRNARRLLLEGVEHALVTAHPRNFMKKHVTVSPNKLIIDKTELDLNGFNRIFVLGAGKASGYLAEDIENLLEERITSGCINILRGTKNLFKTKRIVLNEASHPVPDEDGLKGSKKIVELAEKADRSDLVLCLLSGGGSSLLPLPKDEITLEEKKIISNRLILSGATIQEINTVRKHLSKIKGGWLAKITSPATLISLIISDVVGDQLDVIASGPTSPDASTFQEAITILKQYGIWDESPKAVRDVMMKGIEGNISETPKPRDPCFKTTRNCIIGSNLEICLELREFYLKKGFDALVMTSRLEGEAREVGGLLSSVAWESASSGNPLKPPCVFIWGGETTVTVRGKGKGGRNQELALSAALKLSGLEGVSLTSFGTDGIDGPTDAAGAIIDGETYSRARKQGINPKTYLINNDSYNFFRELGDLIVCGPTGTNVNDVSIAIILP